MIDVVCITTATRNQMLEQTLNSLWQNAQNANDIRLALVHDGCKHVPFESDGTSPNVTFIVNGGSQGASASRNIGAGSIPKYRRQKYVMFTDDDVYFCPGWDKALMELSKALPARLCSGHGHPFNQAKIYEHQNWHLRYAEPLLCSTVNFFMPWEMWDDVGYFREPGGSGGSEDYDWCMRAKAKGYGFAVTEPQCVIHCGLTSSDGKQIVGYNEMVAQNERLIELHGLQGKVTWK